MARIVKVEALDHLREELQAIADVQNLDDDYETVLFLINFYKAFNALLLRGDCTREVKEFIKDEAGWVEPIQVQVSAVELTKLQEKLESLSAERIERIKQRAHVLTVAQQLRILADTLEA